MKEQDGLRKKAVQNQIDSNQFFTGDKTGLSKYRDMENQLKRTTECLAGMDIDPLENIRRLTALCGELMGASCALYSRLFEGMLYSWGQWNVPTEYSPVGRPEGHICYDVIMKCPDDVIVVTDLPQTKYAQSDPNVKKFRIRTYTGKAIKLDGVGVGSLCVFYKEDVVPNEQQKEIMAAIGAAIGIEERRRKAEVTLRKQEMFIDNTLNALTDLFFVVDQNGKLVRWNSSFSKVTGYNDFEISAMFAADFFSLDDRQRVLEAMYTIM